MKWTIDLANCVTTSRSSHEASRINIGGIGFHTKNLQNVSFRVPYLIASKADGIDRIDLYVLSLMRDIQEGSGSC